MARQIPKYRAAVIVAHPDDEILWAGGLILLRPEVKWHIIALSRQNDPDRAPKFFRVLQELDATGCMYDLDDAPEQSPLSISEVQKIIMDLLPASHCDFILTHGPKGEYTRHRRHEEISCAVTSLWNTGRLSTDELWMFAYEDGGRQYLPQAAKDAPLRITLPERVWKTKYRLMTKSYGFSPESWEARATPRVEGFWRFTSAVALGQWLQNWT